MLNQLIFLTEKIKENFDKNNLMFGSHLLTSCTTKGSFGIGKTGDYLLLMSDDKAPVKGNLYEISEFTLKRMDKFQESPDWCFRDKVQVVTENGQELSAWVYLDDCIELN